MKKILSIFIAMLMLLVTFVGCANESENPDTEQGEDIRSLGVQITDEERESIYELYLSWIKSAYGEDYAPDGTSDQFHYYGRYNGFYVLLFPSGWAFAMKAEHIDGLNFSRSSYNPIYAISEEIGGELKDIYGQGYISRVDLEKIHYIHRKMFPHVEDIIE